MKTNDGQSTADVAESVTTLLEEARQGHGQAWDRIYTLLYEDLRRIARSQVRQHGGGRLSPTSLISETWLRLAQADLSATDRPHVTALIARAMRYVLIDQARRLVSLKRGEGAELLTLSHALEASADIPVEQLLQIDQALNGLARTSERTAKVVELRYFGGMKETEIAQLLGVTERTVSREWRKARAYLQAHFGEGDSEQP